MKLVAATRAVAWLHQYVDSGDSTSLCDVNQEFDLDLCLAHHTLLLPLTTTSLPALSSLERWAAFRVTRASTHFIANAWYAAGKSL